MNNKALTLSLVMALIAVFFVESYVSSIEEETRKKFGTEVLVVAAKKDINEMETVDETMLELKKIPKRFLEPSAISFERAEDKDGGFARDLKKLAGNVAIVPIKKGEQITFNKITEPSMRTGLSPQVTPGKRAVAVPINEITGVAKLVKPGDRVDIIAVLDFGGREKKVAKTILQDVVVLAVGRYVTNNVGRVVENEAFGGKQKIRSLTQFDGYSSVTIEVDPEQAQAVALVTSNSANSISLALRNNDDTARSGSGMMMLNDVLGVDRRTPAANVGGGSTGGGMRQ